MAYGPKTGVLRAQQRMGHGHLEQSRSPTRRAPLTWARASPSKPLYDDHIGVLRAMDPKTSKIKWEYKNKARCGRRATADLVFTGTPEGFLKAFDAKTGKELWKFQTGSGVVGSLVTWEMDGEQYVSVVSGWGGAVPLWGGSGQRWFRT